MSAYLTYKLWKALILLAIVAIGGFIYGFIESQGPGPSDKPQDPEDRA